MSEPVRAVTIVTTTIRVPTFLEPTLENLRRHGHTGVSCLVIGDTKTPPEARAFCGRLSAATGVPIRYLGVEDQRAALADQPVLWDLMPLNTGARKLLGNFLAYRDGCETLIMLDDDNFVTDSDFLRWHGVVGTEAELPVLEHPSGWANITDAVTEAAGLPFYARGFPWSQRRPGRSPAAVSRRRVRVAVTNGLVLEDPDIDAVSRLFWPIRVTGLREAFTPQFALAPGTWSPFNNQNTALAREVIPAFYTPAGTGRNADIWASFVICRLAQHAGDAIAFGQPLVRQLRNPHDLWKDLEDERLNNRATDWFVELLREVPLTAAGYSSALGELLRGAQERFAARRDVPADERAHAEQFLREYLIWHSVFAGLREPAAAR